MATQKQLAALKKGRSSLAKNRKKTPKTVKRYRLLTNAEMKAIFVKQQGYVGLLNKLKNNEKILPEVRSVLKRMHKASLVSVDYSSLLSLKNSIYL